MPILSPAQKTALLAELAKAAYTGTTDAQAAALLNTTTSIPNPTPAGQVLPPLTQNMVLNPLTAASLTKIMGLAYFPTFLTLIAANDRAGLNTAGGLLIKGVFITAAEGTAIGTAMAATVTDPNWPATITPPTPFQAIAGLGNATLIHADGHKTVGTCDTDVVTEARS